MKKLMFALIAGVAVSAAQAVDVFADGDGFENIAVDTPATNVNTKFAYIASDTSVDGSAVAAYSGDAYQGSRNSYFASGNERYLNLSTDGGTLYRSILEPAGVNELGPATNLTSSFFIDTLVKFTACDSAQEIDSSAKLAIWLQVSGDNDEYTNLVVRANKMKLTFEDETLESGVAADELYTISGTYSADQWYRLTVEDLGNVFNSEQAYGATGFRIKIDGNAVSAANGNVAVTLANGSSAAGLLNGIAANDTFAAGLTNGSIFLSLLDDNIEQVDYNSTLQAVGFFGTGCVDDILFTSLDPFWTAPSTLDFTLTLGDNVTSVSYTIGEGEPVVVNATSTFKVAPSAQISLNITTASSTWRTYEASVAAGDNATVDGTTVTVKTIVQTDDNQLTAGATVSAVDTATALVDSDVTDAFLGNKGITNAGLLAGLAGDAAGYRSFLTWAENNSYDLARVNGAVNAYTRFSNSWPIEMEVYVGDDEDVTSYAASTNNGVAFNDQTASVTGTKYTVDAGDTLTLDNFVFAAAGANQAHLLDGDNAKWGYGASSYAGLASLTVGAASNSVEFVTDPTVRSAKVSLKAVLISTAPATYDFTVTFSSPVTGVSYVIGEAAAQDATSGSAIKVTAGSSITLTPAASGLDLPLFYTVTADVTNYFSTLTFNDAGSVTIYAAEASSASGEAAETAATNAVAEAVKELAPAQADAVAAKVQETAKATGSSVTVGEVSSWVASKVTTPAQCTALAAAPAAAVEASVKLDTATIFTKEPEAMVSEVTEGTSAGTYDLTFTITDGTSTATPADTEAVKAYVESLVQMTSDLSDWTVGEDKPGIDPTVTVTVDGSTLKATVNKPANKSAVFMKIGK